nr:ATP-binding cassette domain-containing protein [Paracoccus mutanolyticus]
MHQPLPPAQPVLSVRDLRKSYGGFTALDGVSFDLMPGETLAVVGESGSGKSTLARILLRLDQADDGQALWQGRDLLSMPPAELVELRRDRRWCSRTRCSR